MAHERPNLASMTVNERLYVAGLLDEFDRARRRRDRDRLVELLRRVEVEEPELTADQALLPLWRVVLGTVRTMIRGHFGS